MFAIPIAIAAPVIYGLAWGFGTSLVVPTLGLMLLAVVLGALTVWLARRVLEPAERLEQARRILEDAYDRARAEALRDTADRPRQPPGLPGGDGAPVGDRDAARPAAGPGDRRPRRLQADQRRARSRRGRPPAAPGRDDRSRPYLRRSDRAFRVGGDEFAIILPGTDAESAHVTIRRLLAACLDGESDGREPTPRSRSRPGISASLAACARPRRALPPGRRRAVLEQAPRPDVRDGLRPGTPRRADLPSGRGPSCRPRSPGSPRPARIRAVFQPIYDLTHRRAARATRASSGRCRTAASRIRARCSPPPRRPAGPVELDIACLEHGHGDRRRGCACPGILTVNLSPRTLEMDDFSVHALLRMIVRHGLDPRQVVLELTEREAVEDLGPAAPRGRGLPRGRDPPRRRRRRRRQRRAAAAQPAPLRHRQDRPVARPGRRPSATPRSRSSGPSTTWPTAGAPWSSPRASRRRPSSTSSARSGSGPARATCSAGRPTGRRPSRSTWRGWAGAADWLIERLRTMPA